MLEELPKPSTLDSVDPSLQHGTRAKEHWLIWELAEPSSCNGACVHLRGEGLGLRISNRILVTPSTKIWSLGKLCHSHRVLILGARVTQIPLLK